MFTYFTEFYMQALLHFLISAVCAVLFSLGLEFSRGSNGNTSTPYFMPAMVLSGVHFILTIIAMMAFYYAKSLSEIYDGLKSWNHSEKHFRRLKPLYIILQYPCCIWGIAGAAITGNTGVCSNDESPCYHTVNTRQNRAIAIAIVIVHVLNVILSLIIATSVHKLKRDVTGEMNISRIRTKGIEPLAKNFNAKDSNQAKEAENNYKIKLSPVEDQQHLKKQVSEPKYRENHNNKLDVLPPIKQQLHRRHTTNNELFRVTDNLDIGKKSLNKKVVKPLSPNRKKHRFRRTGKLITNLRIVVPRHRNASFIQPQNKTLSRDSNDSGSRSEESDIHPLPKYRKQIRARRLTENPQAPPPPYNQVITSSEYWLPPRPQYDDSLHYLPENIYSGHSYPDTYVAPVYPGKAEWKITN